MKRHEITTELANLENTAKHLSEAWENGDLRKFKKIEENIVRLLNEAREQIKKDLYHSV